MSRKRWRVTAKAKLGGWAAAESAKALERTQIAKFYTKGGTGFAAEDANALADRLRLKRVQVTGTTNTIDGPDRVVNGIPLQTKYYPNAADTIEAAFSAGTGRYRYRGQVLEVPSDQYAECLRLMRAKIAAGKVPGVTDPADAERIVRKGSVTYKQARNIARAGNVDSLVYDLTSQAVVSSYVFAISFTVDYARRCWNGEVGPEAIQGAVEAALGASGTSLLAGVITAQVLRTRAAAVGAVVVRHGVKTVASTAVGRSVVQQVASASLGKAVYGAAAVNHVGKLLRSNAITSAITTAVLTTPDIYRAAVKSSISWSQLAKNLLINASSVAAGAGGSLGGATAGAALGSAVPVIGTAVGAVVGGLTGGLLGGTTGSVASKAALDAFIEDDAARMLELVQEVIEELAFDHLLSPAEIQDLVADVQRTVTEQWLRDMYQAGSAAGADLDRQTFAYECLDKLCLAIVIKRPRVLAPVAEDVRRYLAALVDGP